MRGTAQRHCGWHHEAHLDADLIEVVGERLRLTRTGMLLSNEVFEAFV